MRSPLINATMPCCGKPFTQCACQRLSPAELSTLEAWLARQRAPVVNAAEDAQDVIDMSPTINWAEWAGRTVSAPAPVRNVASSADDDARDMTPPQPDWREWSQGGRRR